jgi:hypothetical protein
MTLLAIQQLQPTFNLKPMKPASKVHRRSLIQHIILTSFTPLQLLAPPRDLLTTLWMLTTTDFRHFERHNPHLSLSILHL